MGKHGGGYISTERWTYPGITKEPEDGECNICNHFTEHDEPIC